MCYEFHVVIDVRYDFRKQMMFCSFLPSVICRRAHVLFTLFVLFFFVLYVYPNLPVYMDCTFLIAPVSNVYLYIYYYYYYCIRKLYLMRD